MKSSLTAIAFVCILVVCQCNDMVAQVQTQSKMLGTKHNLGVSGTGTIRAEAENQLCVFCHTPHVPKIYASAQLWNHRMSTAEYSLYSSEYLTSKNYAAGIQPNERSKLCLSCHDGTVAIGAVYNNRGVTGIAMRNDVTVMPAHAAGNLGTSLANDHPVGFIYDPSKDPELISRAWPWETPVKLDPDASNGTVECITCHEPHDNQYGSFLRVSNANAALCTFCHQKTSWTDAIHRTSTQPITPDSGGMPTTIGEQSCRNCHRSHNGEGVPYLLTGVEENTCYASGCHGSVNKGLNTKDIQSEMAKLYGHPTHTVTGKHKNPDIAASLDMSNRHAECQDCHNSHQARKGLHTTGSNAVSGLLEGSRGVMPGSAAIWTQPASFTEMKPVTQEHQICFTCHSSYAFGLVPDGVTTIIGPSGGTITDQAMEFNPLNRSAHPVQVASNDQTGSPLPRPLESSQLSMAWSATGTQTMYCSDCHGNDQQVSATTPQGPHGSDNRFMLTGSAKYWPSNAVGEPWSLNDVRNNLNNWQSDLFCVNCHPMLSGAGFANNVHDGANHQAADVRCITCHVVVPHGAKRSRLIGYSTDVAPYNFSGMGSYDRLVIEGFFKASGPRLYQKENCSMAGTCHGSQAGLYEP
jgi:predicted CXXCH cytochrome family protein